MLQNTAFKLLLFIFLFLPQIHKSNMFLLKERTFFRIKKVFLRNIQDWRQPIFSANFKAVTIKLLGNKLRKKVLTEGKLKKLRKAELALLCYQHVPKIFGRKINI